MSTTTESYAELIAAIESGDPAWIDTELAVIESARESDEYWANQPKPAAWHFPTPTRREAIEVAAAEPPADHVRAIPVRALVAEAPVLPDVEPLPVPRPHGRSITGPVVKRLIEAGTTAAIVNGPQGVEVLDHFDADDANIVVLADYWEVAPLILVDKQRPTDVASDLLRREQRAWDKAAA